MKLVNFYKRNSVVDFDDTVVHIYDVFTKKELASWVEKCGEPAAVVSDHITFFNLDGIKFIGLPLFFYAQCRLFDNMVFSDEIKTSDCFNFMINKKRVNRHLLIKILELQGLSTNSYTYSGTWRYFDLEPIIEEINLLESHSPILLTQRTEFLGPITLNERVIDDGHINVDGKSNRIKYSNNKDSWVSGINLNFQHSATSLISETVEYDRCSVFTEKTVYALLGLTFPIWIGGYQQASEFRRLGFDIFDDVIDHSYESCETLIERCYHAVSKNIDILTDLDLATKLRQQNKQRLLKNRSRLFDSTINDFIESEIKKQSGEMQLMLYQIIDFFKKSIP